MNSSIKSFAFLAVSLTVTSSYAAVVQNADNQFGPSPYTPTYVPSANDLLQTNLASVSAQGNFSQEGSRGIAALTDGALGTVDRTRPGAEKFFGFATGGNGGGTQVTFTLDGSFDISSVVVYGGWQDDGRDQQSYTLSYATAAAPTTFNSLATVNFNPSGVASQNPSFTRVTISEDTLPALATNVGAIRLDFGATENGYAGYAEIDVIAVPEPGSLSLLGLSTAGVLAFRRRRSE